MVGLSSSRGNNRYGGVRQEQFLRNTNNVVLYRWSQKQQEIFWSYCV